jgi:hypothetical protein
MTAHAEDMVLIPRAELDALRAETGVCGVRPGIAKL